MDVQKVPLTAADQVAQILDSPEVARLIRLIEDSRETGRPGYGARTLIGAALVKSIYALPTWSRTVRLIAEHAALQAVLGGTPSQWACYRFAKQLRTRDRWALDNCINEVLVSLKREHPDLGQNIAIDGSDMPAYAVGHGVDSGERKATDPDAAWGHRSAISTRGNGGFYGYKIHAAVDTATDLPLAWTVQPGNEQEQHFAVPLLDRIQRIGFPVQTVAMDKGYDASLIYLRCEHRGVVPIIPLVKRPNERKDSDQPPHCAHGEWTFAGADYKRRATKWRCPTGECKAASMWLKTSRNHTLIPRSTKRWRELYRKRGSAERNFGRLKHEWSLLPLRVRGIERVRLHADLTILATLANRLAADRSALPVAG